MVTTDECIPAEAEAVIAVETAENVWTQDINPESEIIGDGWIRYRRFIPCGMAVTRLKITLKGKSSARPMIKNISAVVIDV